jgi:hypothetical protein
MGQTASGSVMTTDDAFDKIYTRYQQHMPAGSEKSHTTTPIQMAVFMVGDPASGQKSVTITIQGRQDANHDRKRQLAIARLKRPANERKATLRRHSRPNVAVALSLR